MRVFAQRYHRLRGDALIAETYRKYPYYAIRSDIAEQVLENDEVALSRIESARPEGTPSQLLTIGYEGRTLESYLNALLQASVTVLCDVRRNAISRKYGFSKNALARACDGVGNRYEHLPELGIESRQRRGLESQADFDALFRTYERKSLPRQGDALAKSVPGCDWANLSRSPVTSVTPTNAIGTVSPTHSARYLTREACLIKPHRTTLQSRVVP